MTAPTRAPAVARNGQKPNPLLDTALAYAERGWAVLPLHTPDAAGQCSCGKPDCKGKHPRTQHGLKDASHDPATIRQWWTRWPNANIGLATGAASGGVLVIDIDRAEFYRQWREKVGALADGLTVQKTGKGYHVIFRCDTPGANTILAKLADGSKVIETRGTGGYIMAAPSLHPNGQRYEIESGSLTALPVLKAAEVERILDAARKLDQTPKPEAPADSWKIYTLTDAYAPRPLLQFAAEGLFSLPSVSIVYGAPGTLKSFLLADLAVCVAAGLPWLESLPDLPTAPIATSQAPALWLDFDNGARRTHNRFESLGRARNLPADIPFAYVSMPTPSLDAGDSESLSDLTTRIAKQGARLVIIDNLGLISGAADENSADMTQVMNGLRWLAEYTGAALVVIHHQRKSTIGAKGRDGETLRGHSSIEAALDLALLVTRGEGESSVTVKATKTRDVDVNPFGALFTFEHRAGSKELAAARFYGLPVVDEGSVKAIREAVRESVTAEPGINQAKLVTAVRDLLPKAAVNKVRAEIGRMWTEGKLTVEDGERGAKLYHPPK